METQGGDGMTMGTVCINFDSTSVSAANHVRFFRSRRIVARTNNSNFLAAATMLLVDSAPAAFGADCESRMAKLKEFES